MKEQVNVNWFPEDQDGFMKFQIHVLHGEEHHSLDFKIQPSLLSRIEHTRLDPFLHHAESSDIGAIVSLLDISVRQEHPGYNDQDRNAEMRRLLSSCRLVPSIREIYIETAGRNFVRENGYEDWYERTKFLRPFQEIYQSQQTAFRELDLGGPKITDLSPAEAEELDLFCCELMGSTDIWQTLKKYDLLMSRRLKDNVFKCWLGKTLQNLGRETLPASFRFTLKYYIIRSWTHGFLWGFDYKTRSRALLRLCKAPETPQQEQTVVRRKQVSVSAEAIRKIIKPSGLKGYTDFPEVFHRKAPFKLILDGTGDQEWFQIDFSSLDQFPLSREE
jgi:hypothetical protein